MASRAAEAGSTMARNLIERLKIAAANAKELGRQALIAARQGLIALAQGARTVATALAARLLGALRAVVVLIRTGLVNAIRLLRTNIRLLLLSSGIGALIVAGVLLYEHWDKVKKYAKILADFLLKTFRGIVEWVRKNWKTIAAIMVAIFTFPVGTIAVVVLKFKDRIIGVFRDIVTAVKNLFIDMIKWIKDEIVGIGKKIVDKGREVVNKIKGIFGGDDADPEDEANDRANKILENSRFNRVRPRIKRMRAQGKKGMEILQALVDDGYITEDEVGRISRQSFHEGGVVGGGARGNLGTDAVPAIVHVGEWVLNKAQQSKLLERLRMTADEAKSFLFGGETGKGKAPQKGKTKQTHKGQTPGGNYFNLHEQVDNDGNHIWFIEMDNGAWGQLSARAAARVIRTRGEWIPPHILRSSHGFTKRKRPVIPMGAQRTFARGGVVLPSFAMGGVVGEGTEGVVSGAAVMSKPGQSISKTVSQEFNVKAEGTMDWNYIMRLGAILAKGMS
jgi:hypothetical protein